MKELYTTLEVTKLLRTVTPKQLARAVWDGELIPSAESAQGTYLWTAEDINRASQLFRGRDASDVLQTLPQTTRRTPDFRDVAVNLAGIEGR